MPKAVYLIYVDSIISSILQTQHKAEVKKTKSMLRSGQIVHPMPIGRARAHKSSEMHQKICTFCLVKKKKKQLDLQVFSRIGKTEKGTLNSKYYDEHQCTCNI